MGFFNENVGKLIDKIGSVQKEFNTMSVKFDYVEKSYEKFVDKTETKIDKLQKENEDLRRRMTEIEGLVNSILKESTKEAMVSVFKDYLTENGRINLNDMPDFKKLIENRYKNNSSESIEDSNNDQD